MKWWYENDDLKERAGKWIDYINCEVIKEVVETIKERKMELDKSRVYTALNADELRVGDKVIVANTMAELKGKLSRESARGILTGILDENWYGRFEIGNHNYSLAYLVERKENCTNCGKTECSGHSEHEDFKVAVCSNWKPKTEPRAEKKYRPFANTDELIKVWEKKWSDKTNGQKWHDCKLNMPHIWVKRKDCSCKGQLITEFSDEIHVGIGRGEAYNMTDLWVHFTFLDGSPCGVEE